MQVVEITKGSKVKYELDKKTGLIKVSQLDFSVSDKSLKCINHVPILLLSILQKR